MIDHRFPREHHISRGADFKRAYAARCSASDGLIVVFAAPNGLAHPRLGLSVSRKVGPAVVRNRWKRLMREAFRLSRGELPAGLDLVVIPRAGAEPSLVGLERSLPRLARNAARRVARAAKQTSAEAER